MSVLGVVQCYLTVRVTPVWTLWIVQPVLMILKQWSQYDAYIDEVAIWRDIRRDNP